REIALAVTAALDLDHTAAIPHHPHIAQAHTRGLANCFTWRAGAAVVSARRMTVAATINKVQTNARSLTEAEIDATALRLGSCRDGRNRSEAEQSGKGGSLGKLEHRDSPVALLGRDLMFVSWSMAPERL